MVAAVSNPVLQVLPDLPRDVSPSVRWGLIAGVLVVHAVVAALVVLTSRLPSVVAEAAPISVSLLTQAPSGEFVPAAPPVVQPHQAPVPVSKSVAPSPAPVIPQPQVAAVAAPAQAHDMVVPVAPAVVDRKAAVDVPVTPAAAVAAPQTASASAVADAALSVASAKPVQLTHTAVRYLRKVEPVFPKMSARLGEYGTVIVSVVVDDHGLPANATVARSSGYSRLDAAARDAAMQSRYVPYTLNGVPQRFEVPAPFSFTPPTE
ncbi:MAG: TonB family protein [Burkholderiales bacterium]|nr:TonB family protein [Burkholderiales bacterium]